jgi:uncharacterized protein DUF6600/FecR-like protein
MNGLRRVIFGTVVGALLLLSMTFATAQDNQAPDSQGQASQAPAYPEANQTEQYPPGRPEQDPPGRVARLQFMSGSVSIQPQGTGDWVEGSLNRPLTNSDNIWADKDSKAELNAGTGILRINSESSLTLTNISDNAVQVRLHQGTLNLRVRKLYDGENYEVQTPNLTFTVQKPGEYRFDVDPGGDATVVNVWKGEGEASGEGPAVRVQAHEQARFTDGTSLTPQVSEVGSPDSFDEWCDARNRREDHSASARYVSPDVIGSEDLDQNGTWSEVPPYGPVWAPAVAPGWAPYRFGHWAWIDPWGWTWVDDASWGFAPFHYGRWIYTGGYWGWSPGPYYDRPFYAPALVAWFGGPRWGGGFGFGVGGGFGWCPLGFGEPFFPWYRGSRGYFRNVNIHNTRITNITNVTNNYFNNGHRPVSGAGFHYANLRAPGGITAASQRAISGAMPISRNAVRVSAKDAEGAQLRGNLPLSPTRESRLGANAGRPAAMPPARGTSRPANGTAVASLGHADRSAAGAAAGRQSSPGLERSAPRPAQSSNIGGAGSRNVPRPPMGGPSRSETSQSASTRSPEIGKPSPSRPSLEQRGSSRPSEGSTYSRPANTVPRPTGPVRPAPSNSGREYGSRSAGPMPSSRSRGYSGAPRSYGGSPRYGAPPPGRGYGSAPAYHGSAPAYHGSSGSPHGSSGGYSGGGGHSGGGGGGHSSGGGGGHSGGGHSGGRR